MSGVTSYRFSQRMTIAPRSFLGELFRVSTQPGVISFAGGLPDASLFDLDGIRDATMAVLNDEGQCALQYTTTDGYLPLRKYIADRYFSRLGLRARPEEIQIVNGSQQCLDLIAKILVDPGDHLLLERPGYLGAIEAFSFYEPVLDSVPPMRKDAPGPDAEVLKNLVSKKNPAFFYG
ncbi:MAG: aminotransferase class I/II-fold pyridoxal phosphate-dependent enzyme, partial [Methanobacteriota archaeon]